MKLHRFQNPEELNQQFAKQITECLAKAIHQRGHAYLAVAGGKTPLGLFKELADADLAWEKITITLTDERFISPTDPDSNEFQIKQHLLKNKAANAQFISLYQPNIDELEGQEALQNRMSSVPAFDVVLLGMGEDGHTASLFPCSKELAQGLETTDNFLIVHPGKAPYKRISLSKARLLKSRNIFLQLVGTNKLNTLEKALSGADPLEMPIRVFLHHPEVDLQIMFAP
ncbi:6-phosphogluconolactonase [Legionella jordanis]|uniref:6-phosphogluconolactonase n=1 Tax=Legionella jordanis TaxID=456 RepID=A0A0W0VAG9_9GAMM|nr:6-phosphogluconolactonase [Legionella jordanis]KTD17071.1 6-phosphogluconolactonase [Legionella jordanis]RMX03204.1 6-phosphogluconolactonase [Legionella jordanis]VEH12732.1 6-phosphogluconolactonase [Legionella jordanis]HAT8713119.1 6-phosphogluconolactonase [Legionella jordanis]